MSPSAALAVVALAALGVTPGVARLEQKVLQAQKEADVDHTKTVAEQAQKDAAVDYTNNVAELAQKDAAVEDSKTVAEQEVVLSVPPPMEHSLRVCNGYAAAQPIVVAKEHSDVTTQDPIDYKKCADLTMHIKEGDDLLFNVGSLQVGAFTASGLPESKNPLLLVVYRRSKTLMSAAFESHVYDESQLAQLAVVNTYKGAAENTIEISRESGRPQPLNFGAIAFVNPGDYGIFLTGPATSPPMSASSPASLFGGSTSRGMNVTIKPATSYVAMRVGLDGSDEFPEELVLLGGAAAPLSALALLAVPFLALLLRDP